MLKNLIIWMIAFPLLIVSCEKPDDLKPDPEPDDDIPVLTTDRDPFAGVYAIWYGGNETVLKSKYLKGGQVVVQWRDCEPQEGKYNFSLLESKLADMAKRGLKTTVQVNGSLKPEYLFEKVPYLPRAVHVQVQDALGSLMYWHPYFTQSYLNFITAYANYIKSSPYKSIITGIRQNFNQFGTEIGWFEGLYALPQSDWVIPPGVSYVKPSSAETSAYEEKVLKQFITAFSPGVKILFRSGVDAKFINANIDLIEDGKIGFFQTGAAMEQNQWFEQDSRYDKFIAYCKPGTTFGFSEIMSGRVQPYSEVQWQYWRVLSELHCGISYIGTRATPFEKAAAGESAYINILDFASRYVGYHALPVKSPGAWFVFRGKGDNFPWDYTFLMDRTGSSVLTDLRSVGSDTQPYGAWAQQLAVGSSIFLDIHDSLFVNEKSAGAVAATVRVVYYDSGEGNWSIKYDAADNPDKLLKQVTNGNSLQWKILEIPVTDGYFGNRSLSGADLVIENTDAAECILHMVEIKRSK